MEIVRIKNVGDTEFRDGYDSNPYRVQPGSEAVVPFEAACLWLGDPNARDIDARHRNRVEAFARLRVRWGVYDNLNEAANMFPKLEVYDLEGNRIWMVVDDPEGEHVNESSVSNAAHMSEVNLLRAQLEQMKAQQAQILSMLASKTQGDTIDVGEISPLQKLADTARQKQEEAIAAAGETHPIFQPAKGSMETGPVIIKTVVDDDDDQSDVPDPSSDVTTDTPSRVRISNPTE